MRVGVVAWPDELDPDGEAWPALAAQVRAHPVDLLVTNELPFGPWLARSAAFTAEEARRAVELDRRGAARLAELGVPPC